jgi:hypothetical protein
VGELRNEDGNVDSYAELLDMLINLRRWRMVQMF